MLTVTELIFTEKKNTNYVFFTKENEMLSETSEELFRLNSEDITCRFCKDAMLPVTLALKVSWSSK